VKRRYSQTACWMTTDGTWWRAYEIGGIRRSYGLS
jgi:hypothetical protein